VVASNLEDTMQTELKVVERSTSRTRTTRAAQARAVDVIRNFLGDIASDDDGGDRHSSRLVESDDQTSAHDGAAKIGNTESEVSETISIGSFSDSGSDSNLPIPVPNQKVPGPNKLKNKSRPTGNVTSTRKTAGKKPVNTIAVADSDEINLDTGELV
jgi:hypothetical protein